MYQQYLHDRSTVDESWKHVFDDPGARPSVQQANGGPPATVRTADPASTPAPQPGPQDELQPLRGVAGKIAENMSASLAIPLATSQRSVAVKVMDENRRIINQHRTLIGCSGWSIWATRP